MERIFSRPAGFFVCAHNFLGGLAWAFLVREPGLQSEIEMFDNQFFGIDKREASLFFHASKAAPIKGAPPSGGRK